MEAKFIHHGDPVPKARPRLGRGGNVYTPKSTLEAESNLGWAFRKANKAWTYGPKARYGVVIEFGVSGQHGDIDNLVKTVLDGLNGVAWADDRQVWAMQVSKKAVAPGTGYTAVLVREVP